MLTDKISKNDNQNPWGLITGIRPVKQMRQMLDSGKSEDDVREYFKNVYKVSDKKIEVGLDIARKEILLTGDCGKKNISLYIGIPFCPTRCVYCSFATNGADRFHEHIDKYLETLYIEMEKTDVILKQLGFNIECVYIGGGTPTTLSANALDCLIKKIKDTFDLSNMREFTVEAGRPDTLSEDKLRVLKDHNISRISINPQSMNQQTLDAIGRRHTVSDIVKAYEMAHKVGIYNINSDIIAGLPGENADMFSLTLDEVLKLCPTNVTIHTLSVKRASRLKEELDSFEASSASGSEIEKMVDMAYDRLTLEGFYPYYLYKQKNQLGNLENIGYAKEGFECLYNIYIMEEIQTIISMGCGGVTKLVKDDRIERIFNVKDIFEYFNRYEEMIKRKDYIYEFLGE